MKTILVTALFVALLCAVLWIYVIEPLIKKINSLKKTVAELSSPSSQNKTVTEKVVSVFADRTNEIVTFLRERHDAGESCKLAVQSTVKNFAAMGENYVLGLVSKAGYPALDLATVMAEWNYSPDDVREKLCDDYEMSVTDAARILLQVFPKESVEEKLKLILDVFGDEDDLNELIPILVEISASPVVVGELLSLHTNLRLAQIVTKLGLQKDPVTIVEIAKEAEVDLMDSDEYNEFRDDTFEFEDMATILAKSGKTAEEILDTEGEYDSFDFDDKSQRESVFKALRPCGFCDTDILKAVNSLVDLSVSVTKIVLSAIENEVSLENIVVFLKPSWEDDINGLWEEFQNDDEITEEDSVEILYALIPPEKRRFNKPIEPKSQTE